MDKPRTLKLLLAIVAVLVLAAACETGTDGDEEGDAQQGAEEQETDDTGESAGEGGGGDLIVGTTDEVVSLDPAKIYDYYSSNILFNAGERLVGFEAGEVEVTPQLAEDVEISEDGLTYTFTLREGVTFHNGKEMDSEDVVFSLERALNMDHPQGAAFLIGGIEEIEAPDDTTVEITLSEPNVTFLSRLAYTVATIVPADGTYPAPDGPLEDDAEGEAEDFVQEDFVGTGPYEVTDFREGESLTLEAHDDYWGEEPRNERVLVQFYDTSSQLKLALESGEVDVAFRDVSPDERADLAETDGIQTVVGEGATIRYLVLNTTIEPLDDPDVRRAIAAAVDRERIVEDVFNGNGEPLYSMIASGFDEYRPFFQEYEDQEPSDFIDEPVDLELWHETGDHYGPTEPSFAQVLQRSLEETDMFNVELNSSEWAQFTEQAWPGEDGQYPAFLLGWYPDYFDADDYIEPFYHSEGFLGMYQDEEMDQLIAEEQQVDDPAASEREDIFEEIQRKAADDAPLIPLYEQDSVVFAQEGVTGLEETMDPVQIFRYWLIEPGE